MKHYFLGHFCLIQPPKIKAITLNRKSIMLIFSNDTMPTEKWKITGMNLNFNYHNFCQLVKKHNCRRIFL